jgi:phosphate-selective porin OprO/OprP
MRRSLPAILVAVSSLVVPRAGAQVPDARADQQRSVVVKEGPPPTAELEPTVEELRREIEALRLKLQEAPALEQRILELEKKIAALVEAAERAEAEQARLEQEKKQRLVAYYRDGFFLATPDDKFRLQIGGVLQFDTRVFGGGAEASPGGFDVRRGRYDLRGTIYGGDLAHAFRLQVEMANSPYLRNAYWIFKFGEPFHLQVGQFKPPSGGADWLTEEAQINFVEYSIHPPVTPFFDRGFNIHTFLAGRRVQANLAIVTGVGADVEVSQGDLDNHKDVAARVLVVPWKGRKGFALEGLHVAGNYQNGLASIRSNQGGEAGYRTENFESRWYDWKAATMDLERRARYGWEVHLIRGPLAVSYEWDRVEWTNITSYTPGVGSLRGRARADVGQVWVSYFLTGEQKTFEDVFFAWRQPKPKQIFSLKDRTFGAWEVIAKYSYKDTSDALFDLGILEGSRRGHAITGGVRWLWNPRVRIMVDVNHLESTEGQGIVAEYAARGAMQKRFIEQETALLVRFILAI